MSLVRNIAGVEMIGTIFSGHVVNSTTGQAIPGATVKFISATGSSITKAADANGMFSLSTDMQITQIVITSTGYTGMIFPASAYQTVFELEPLYTTLPDVVVTSNSKPFPWLLLLGAIPLITKKKTVGKVDTGTVVAVAAGVLFLKGFGLFNSLLESLGLQDSASTKDLDAAASNPLSPWSPNFYKSGPAGTYLLTMQGMQDIYDTLNNSFGWFNDDEAAAIAVFKQLKTQSQLSFFAEWFKNSKGVDLLYWLRGTGYPNDRLSDAEVDSINQYILKLPKYIA